MIKKKINIIQNCVMLLFLLTAVLSSCTVCYYKYTPRDGEYMYVDDAFAVGARKFGSNSIDVYVFPLRDYQWKCVKGNDPNFVIQMVNEPGKFSYIDSCLKIEPYIITKGTLRRTYQSVGLSRFNKETTLVYSTYYSTVNSEIEDNPLHIYYEYKTDSMGTLVVRKGDIELFPKKHCYERGFVMH